MYQVTEQELDTICEGGNYKTLDVALFALCAGVLASLWITTKTVVISDATIVASFTAAKIVSGLGALFFGVRGIIAWRATRNDLKRIKQDHGAS